MKLPVLAAAPPYRFACHGCGACCRTGWQARVTPEEAARFAGHDWAAEDARFAGGFLDEEKRPDGTVEVRLRWTGGRCIFLDPDDLCRIHKRLGGEAKPDVCQKFPLSFVRAPDGSLDVTVLPECETWHDGHRTGEIVDPRDPTFARIAERTAVPAPDSLPLREGGPVVLAWDEVRDLQRRLGARTAAAPDLSAAFAAWREEFDRLSAAKDDPGDDGARRSFDEAARFVLSLLLLMYSRALSPLDHAAAPAPGEAIWLAYTGGEGADGKVPSLGAAAARLLEGDDALAEALASLDADPEVAAYARAAVRALVEGPALAIARLEVEAVVGATVLFAHLLAPYATLFAAAEGRARPTAADVNQASKRLSVFLRNDKLRDVVAKARRSFRALVRAFPAAARPR